MIMVKILGKANFDTNETNGDYAQNVWSEKLTKTGVFTCENMNEGQVTVFDYAGTYV